MASPSTILLPCLLYSHDKEYRNKTLCNIALSTHQSCSVQELKHKIVMASSHGWLILMTYKKETNPIDHCYSLWNPITFESIDLPPLNLRPKHRVKSFILSTPPTCPSSMLLLFEKTIPAIFACRTSSSGEWIELRYSKLNINYHLRNPVSYNGMVFAVGRNNKLFHVEFKHDNTIFLRPLPLIPAPHSHFLHVSLVECCGDLYTVYYYKSCTNGVGRKEILAVNVYKLKIFGMVWEKVDNIDDHAFFLSKNHTISCPAHSLSSFPAQRNRIYFTMEEEKNKIILSSYHVEEGTLTMSRPCPDLPKPWISAIWVTMPTLGTNKGEEERKDDEKNVFFPWTNLGMDLKTLIVEKLHIFDYMKLRVLCKMNRLIAPPIQWKSIHLLSPWLIFSPSGKNVCNFLDPTLTNERYLVKTPKLFQDPIVGCCKESWLLMSTSEAFGMSVFLFNPFTMATIQLPYLQVENAPVLAFSFSSSPYSDNGHCSVVCFLYWLHKFCFYVTGPGKEEWSFLEFPNTRDFHPNNNAPVFWNGAFYYLGEDARLGVFRLEERRMITWEVLDRRMITWEVFDMLWWKPKDFHRNYLVECDGRLLSVFVGQSGEWVQVCRLSSRNEWETVHDLGKHVLYLSRLSTLCKVAQVEGTENRIYFERLHGERAIFYSLGTQKFHTSDGKNSLTSYYNNTSEPLLCAWIQPPRWC